MTRKSGNKETRTQKPKYPQPHNITDVTAEDSFQEMILILKQHARLKQEARYGNRNNGRSNGQLTQRHKQRKYQSPYKRLPYG